MIGCARPDGRRRLLGQDDDLYHTLTIDRVSGTRVTYTESYTPECKADCPARDRGPHHHHDGRPAHGPRDRAGAVARRRAAKRRCRLPSGAKLVARTTRVLIYTDDELDTYLCERPAGRRRILTPYPPTEFVGYGDIRGIKIVGAFAAYAFTTFLPTSGPAQPVAQLALLGPRGCSCGPDIQIQIGDAANLLAYLPTAQGQLIWVASAGDRAQLLVAGRGFGKDGQVVDSGAIDPASVQVAGTTLSWTNGGAPKTLSLSR